MIQAGSALSRRRAIVAIGAVTTVGAVPRGARAQATKTFTFGLLAPMTGFAAELGTEQIQGTQLAVDDINGRGGVAGWTLKAIPVDHKGTAAGGVQAMNQLANLEKVPYVIGGFAGVLLAAYPIAAQNQILMLNIGGISTGLLDKEWLYNDMLIGEPLNSPLAQYVWEKGIRSVAMLTGEDPLGQDNSKVFAADFIKRGGKIVAAETFALGSTDFSPQIAKIRAANPQGVYNVVAGDTQGLMLKQMRANGITGLIFGLGQPTLYQIAGAVGNGFISTGVAVDWTSKSRNVQHFYTAFKAKYNHEPGWPEGNPFETVHLLAQLIESASRAGKDPRSGANLLEALKANPSFPNYLSGGTVYFRKDHGVTRAVSLQELRGDKWVNVRIITPQ